MFSEIGTIEALLSSISTLRDGSVKITFEVNPDNQSVINKLMSCYLTDKKLFTLGIVQGEDYRGKNDGEISTWE
jgi:hypothetical protein